ncbi:ABC transporter ATP-binding protein [Leucothrix arctica]|uniref:Iron ABC transporter ATP-binding protein n=1 Tax=Leucothrix arctica TaxID=1481894 RepID=A0A317CAK8_9GAMM|nr:ATP-binding cassette domain-containing protein [Leucothrix arctica]PWQ95171.1 iron ABC transporter ATP-binding protein [Leucothrix arctica]
MIRAVDLTLTISGHTILNKVSVDVPKNKVTALIGPNGAGKSTLLHTIARLTKQDSGQVLLDNRSITDFENKELARHMSILRQDSAIGSRLKVRDLVSFGRYPHNQGRHSASDDLVVDKVLVDFELDALAERFLDTLSGGQRQRALLAMNFAQDAEAILLDEPLNNLDLSHARQLMHTVKHYVGRGKTFVVVLHDLNYAARYADHIIAMKQGEVFAAGDTSSIFNEGLLSDLYETPIEIVKVNGLPMALSY